MELQGDVGHVEPRLDLFGVLLVLVQDGCSVCAKRSTGSETILDAPDGTPR